MTNTVISLRCPLSGVRMVTPARFAGVRGLAAFDLDTFLAMAERTRKWQCPHRCDLWVAGGRAAEGGAGFGPGRGGLVAVG
jgi:hypothetical protein